MPHQPNYRLTARACYMGNFTQAIVVNLTPVLFIPLREHFGFSYGQFGTLVLLNFLTQLACDLLFSKAVDRHGFRPFVVSAHALVVLGFALFAATPLLFPGNVYAGFLIATIIFSAGGGLLELLLSPIVDSLPGEEKAKAMAMLHSFYAWGQVVVVILTTLWVYVFGAGSWQVITLLWIAVPLTNVLLFSITPLRHKASEMEVLRIRDLIRQPVFLLAFLAMLFGGASEVTMSQWASSFLQKGLDLPKIVGDTLGLTFFAVMMGVGRLFYGLRGHKMNLSRIMIVGSAVAAICYVVVALSPWKGLSIVACALTGLCVSLLWPGTLTETSAKLPLAGASMFALLAAGGDLGCSVGPWLTGIVTDAAQAHLPANLLGALASTPEQMALRVGILAGVLLPLCSLAVQLVQKHKKAV